MAAYYNEIDPYAAQWLRNLIAAGHIAPGDVDERSIEDVHPDDLRGYTQCHFFAGIGVWSYALRRAGWPDDRPVWTGSCPCQPFSAAGKGAGFDDERHLWPDWHHLIKECRPPAVFGEQVAAKNAEPWVDLVHADLEAMGYAFGAVPFPSAGIGAPHIRDRLFWAANANDARLERRQSVRQRTDERIAGPSGLVSGMGNTDSEPARRNSGGTRSAKGQVYGASSRDHHGLRHAGNSLLWLADAEQHCSGREAAAADHVGAETNGPSDQHSGHCGASSPRPGPVNGFWSDADWLLCRDGKWRPVEPGYEQMADGSAGSLGRMCATAIQKIEEEINAWSIRYNADAGEALRSLWNELSAQALCEREIGRFSGVQSPAVLLAFLRQLTEQGWRFSDSLACSRSGASEIVLRVMRFDPEAARTPLRRELEQQLAGQSSDPLRELPSIMAYHAAQCWGNACREKAGAASFPLSIGAVSRVGRLRAYGNAINAQAAEAFIRAAM